MFILATESTRNFTFLPFFKKSFLGHLVNYENVEEGGGLKGEEETSELYA
jgi:hypothetical protein